MARKKEDIEQLEAENTQLENSNSEEPQSESVHTDKIFGDAVTPENLANLAGMEVGVFPQKITLTNATSSELTFAEIGVSLLPYEQKRMVTIRNQGMLDIFCMNYAYLAELSQWNEHYGVLIQAANKE